jgi:photosystem II stability/assembly factor-like uncharacterized protein
MKFSLSILIFSLLSILGYSQAWLSAPYMEIKTDGDEWKRLNFYEIQAAFRRYEATMESQQTDREARVIESEKGEYECGGQFPGFARFKRWEAFMEPRVYPSGDLREIHQSYDNFQEYLRSNDFKDAAINKQNTELAVSNWVPLGPWGTHWKSYFGGAGRVTFLRLHPSNTDIMWTMAPSGGLWKTVDGGQNWTTNTDQLPFIGATDLAINPLNPNEMYLAMGDGNGTNSQLWQRSVGIRKSLDGGATWPLSVLTYTPNSQRSIYKLLINPIQPNIIFAATSIGLLRSVDAGATWPSVVGAGIFTDIEFKPGDPTVVYATSGSTANGTFYKSIDGGATFVTTAVGVPLVSAVARMEVAVSAANPDLVYLLAVKKTTNDFYGFYRSLDSGDNFTLQATTPNILTGIPSAQAHYNLAMAVSALHEDTILVGATDMYRSLDAGLTWTKITSHNGFGVPFVHPDHHDIQFLPGNDSTYFSMNDGGVWKTTDRALNWTPMNEGIGVAQMYRLGTSKISPYTILTGHQDMATHRLTGNVWDIVTPNTGDGVECIYEHDNDTIFYMETYYGRILKMTNTLGSMAVVCSFGGAGVNANGNWLTPFIMNPSKDSVLLVGKAQLYRSYRAGAPGSMVQVGNIVGGAGNLVALAYAASDTNYIYAAKSNRMFLTTDGNNFNDITGILPVGSASITAIAVSNADPGKAWVTFSGFSAANKVWQTTDAGVTWMNYTTGLPNLPASAITYQNGSNDGLYVGTDVGVYYRDNSLAAWQPFMTNLPNVNVQELEICYLNGKLRAATAGRGLWETDLATPLPVSLQSFAAECNSRVVKLNWSTASELASDEFVIERSREGADYQAIGSVDAAGTSSQTISYAFTDREPLYGSAYYRLKQRDADGSVEYSQVVVAGCDAQLHVTIYPNPNNGRFQIRAEATLSKLEIQNVLGELVLDMHVNATEAALDLTGNAKGIYFYKAETASGESQSGKIVVR